MTMYLSSLMATLWLEPLDQLVGRKPTYIMGCLLVLTSCSAMLFLTPELAKWTFLAAIATGIGTATMVGGSGVYTGRGQSLRRDLENAVMLLPLCQRTKRRYTRWA
jgi:MFS family permease